MIKSGEKSIKELLAGYIPYDVKNEMLCEEKTQVGDNITISNGIARLHEDAIDHPIHYTKGNIEVIDYIEDKCFNYHRGNAIKYISRAGLKNKETEVQDLKKAIWYLNREIDRLIK